MSCTPDNISNHRRPVALAIRFAPMNFLEFVAMHESVRGTFRTCCDFQVESAFGGKAEVGFRDYQGQLLARSGRSVRRQLGWELRKGHRRSGHKFADKI